MIADNKYFLRYFCFLLLSVFLFLLPTQSGQARGPNSVADIAAPLFASVVNISTSQTVKGSQGVPLPQVPKGSPFEEFFEDFFSNPEKSEQRRVRSLGSGFVVDPSGLIVTNNHVIEGAEEIVANFNDGTKLKVVKIIGRDTKTDLALLKVVPKKPLKAVKFANSSKIRVGDWVLAIGNPFGLGGSLTVGVVSAKKRDIQSGLYDEFIQTDASINQGNSGGPLFNMEGKVVGINTAIMSPTGVSIGIGFSVPSNTAKRVISQLQKYGETRRGWLGVRIQSLSDEIAESLGLPSSNGALIAGVTPGSPADKAGITAGDVVLKFNNTRITTYRTLPRLVANTDINTKVKVEFFRKGKIQTTNIIIGRLDETKSSDRKLIANIPDAQQVLEGVKITGLDRVLRKKYNLDDKVTGVAIVSVKENSVAAQRGVKVGDIIVEVTQEEVRKPEDVAIRVERVRKSGRKAVLLLLSDGKGDLRFVAVPIAKK